MVALRATTEVPFPISHFATFPCPEHSPRTASGYRNYTPSRQPLPRSGVHRGGTVVPLQENCAQRRKPRPARPRIPRRFEWLRSRNEAISIPARDGCNSLTPALLRLFRASAKWLRFAEPRSPPRPICSEDPPSNAGAHRPRKHRPAHTEHCHFLSQRPHRTVSSPPVFSPHGVPI